MVRARARARASTRGRGILVVRVVLEWERLTPQLAQLALEEGVRV